MSAPSALPVPLVVRDLAKAYGDRVVLDGVDLLAAPGRPVGLVGENGVGKSTLLRLVAGLEPPDAGTVTAPADLGRLGQEPDFPPHATVAEVLADPLAPAHHAVAELERLAGLLAGGTASARPSRRPDLTEPADPAQAYAALLGWAELHDAWGADRRAEQAADRLGLAAVDRDRPVTTLSGGQRSRLALAALLVRRPACLLLDEPSNHLDDEAVAFLDAVCSAVVDLDPAYDGPDGSGSRATRFTGGYTAYLAAKRAARRRWEEAYAARQDELDALRVAARTTARQVAHNRPPRDNDKFIHHHKGANVARTVSRRVRDTERRIDALEADQVPRPPRQLTFQGFSTHQRVADRGVAQLRDVEVPGRLRLPRLDLAAGDRLLVTGANGSGKSTLLHVLAGRLAATGTVHVSARRVGHLPQEVVFRHPDRTPHQLFADATDGEAGNTLVELGLLHPRDLARPVRLLSVGQRRRLALAVVVARQPDLLLLDEPTNHISLALAEELEAALQRSPGTVVVASHDRWLRRRWAGPELGL